jgi:hypothetical protein
LHQVKELCELAILMRWTKRLPEKDSFVAEAGILSQYVRELRKILEVDIREGVYEALIRRMIVQGSAEIAFVIRTNSMTSKRLSPNSYFET